MQADLSADATGDEPAEQDGKNHPDLKLNHHQPQCGQAERMDRYDNHFIIGRFSFSLLHTRMAHIILVFDVWTGRFNLAANFVTSLTTSGHLLRTKS